MEQKNPSEWRPELRPLDVSPETRGDQEGVVLTDPLGISDQQVFVPEGLLPVVSRFDGTKTIEAIEQELTMAAGGMLPVDLVAGIARQLEQCDFLESAELTARVQATADAFTAQSVRPSVHAGRSAGYPGTADAVREALDSMIRRPDPGGTLPRSPRGLVAPHIDLARGREGYSMAYGALAECQPADLYVVFGTGHQGPGAIVTGLPMDWDCPLGAMPTDREFVAAVHERLGPAAPRDLFLHRQEHSIEFQMLFLKHLVGDHPAQVAGFLTGHVPHEEGSVSGRGEVGKVIDTFRGLAVEREAAGRRVCFVAGADLAHIGPEFGDDTPIDSDRLDRLTADESERLTHLENGDPDGFHASIEANGNPDRVCGTTPMLLTAALAGGPGQLLHYGQANAPGGHLTVSYCAMLFEGAS